VITLPHSKNSFQHSAGTADRLSEGLGAGLLETLVNLAIRQIEDQILAKMEEAEQLKTQLEEAQRAMNKEEGVVLEETSCAASPAFSNNPPAKTSQFHRG
jgi:hypothetical protein